jgi:hypothetical protein
LIRAPRAALRLAASALVIGLLAAAPAAAAGGDCTHDTALEAAVSGTLRKKVQDIQPNPRARIEITFGCPAVSEPHQITALLAHGHGGFVSVFDLDHGSGGAVEARALRLQPTATPTLGGPPPKLAAATIRPGDEAVRQALAFATTALASTIRIELPPPAPGKAQTIAARATTHDEALEIHLAGRGGQSAVRRWSGYVDSTHAAERVPLEVAWEALWGLTSGRLPSEPTDVADRAVFRRLLEDDGPRPGFLKDGLLEMGALLATRPVVPALTPFLQAPSKRTVTLAVNALATATGTDLRHDARGALRPLADVAAAYRALVTEKAQPGK